MRDAVIAAAQWWEDDLGFLVAWALAAGFFVVYRLRGENGGLQAGAGALCVAGFIGGWYAGYQPRSSGMHVPLAQDVAMLTGLLAGAAYVVAVLMNDRRAAAPDGEAPDEAGTPPEES